MQPTFLTSSNSGDLNSSEQNVFWLPAIVSGDDNIVAVESGILSWQKP